MGGVLETAHDMGREWRFLSALAPTDVPVPVPVPVPEPLAKVPLGIRVIGR